MNLTTLQAGSLQMVAAMIISGSIGLFVLESGQGAFNVVFFRCVFGAVALGVYCAARRLLKRDYFNRRMLLLCAAGGAAIVFNWVLLFAAFKFASISIATAVYNTQPFMLIGLGVLFMGDRITISKLLWVVTAFLGLLHLVGVVNEAAELDQYALHGFLLALGAAFLYAVAALVIKRLVGVPPQLIAFLQVSLGVLLLLPMVDFTAQPTTLNSWSWLVALGLLHTALMYILLYSAIQVLPTARVAVLSFIYPTVAFAVDHAVYGQHLDGLQWAGIALIALGNLGVNLGWTLPGTGRRSLGARDVP